MKSPWILIIFALFLASCFAPPKNEFHLFILSGQSNMVGLDPGASFSPAVETAFGTENVIIVKDAEAGAPIRRWYREWKSPDGGAPGESGDLYQRLMNQVAEAIKGRKVKTVTFIWMQGEEDAYEGHGNVYADSLNGLVQQISEDLNRDDINFVIGRLSDFDLADEEYPHWTRVRNAQVEVADSRRRTVWVNTDDLNDGRIRNGERHRNNLHYGLDGYKTLGSRFADAAIELINNDERE